ncbi:Kinesin heavy chain,Kinesin-like protein KIN-14Q,Kinesin-like protein KIF18B,Kinesin-like protein KIF3B,Kinesin-like protein KIN-12D,Kinesin-like protein KIN-7I,Chromosome-associated kinesin KIF4,Kinesin-like protein KIN-12B,Kinesin-like protein KIN-12E,Kinesin-like protein 5,Kinesin-II 85 kDa subunit,Kinesin-II 95 kDa subunit,Kinesin-like protein KIF15-A,Kinesin-related protein 3,Kinesin-like protein unc-104,Kinesin-like protein KIF18A,Kinesin-like protein KIN-14P,Kinesin-1 heavy chain,Kinesin-like protei|uniref:Kinesin-like protein n=1 Tax=Mytilus edulis TaxID=6550 RepID=A0A8S3SDQ6_MYTED|nr:Kinesin heavy chain,Kinesin-like protein KIN-14Q,Kinesin-like protein KIF18B,Kinesin-like protein KIF3B,Kinesin-like protein KIN-12D,Kinesin-like protein KIN-7I,Chromosome-associated kinesin KIF4,Kinesin-like protein KIN-12B,Kinesin-like protein KIN-12E,Kinesin-like protein 5,Kinesin-II 85 kDa subunit,Kinesin-II 95 kDa subunit,Kinesin-like protein KIF15-A,Kinesin-related protein 3,Kinesin-like protein unc-104,Kinesin-like protein KIF18A,Kinesin-like protein KIN-14P,Kinesin-1 heavy chain,Kinesin-
MLEIYNEQVRDLLNPKTIAIKGGLKVRQDPKKGFYVEQMTSKQVNSYEEIDSKINEGTRNRTVASTNMNATSSRAHTIIGINFTQKCPNDVGESMTRTSVVNLVDLAGSERADSTGATGDRLKEGSAINKSLSTLGNVIKALADQSTGNKKVVVPYRDSTLTKLLQNALGGNSKTIMVIVLADRAKAIKTTATVNESPTDKLIRELREENAKLMEMIKSGGITLPIGGGGGGGGGGGYTTDEVEEMKRQLQEQLNQNQSEMEQMKKSWQQKLAESEQENLGKLEEDKKKNEDRKVIPHFWNLNEDPALTAMVIHFCNDGKSTIGTKNAQPPPNIQINGLSIQKQHAIVTNKGMNVTLEPCSGAKILVNGQKIAKGVQLHHNDRVLFGPNHLYVFHHPKDASKNIIFNEEIYKYDIFPKIEVSSEENREENFTQTYDTSEVQIYVTCYTEEMSHATDLLDLFLKGDVCLDEIMSNSLDTIKEKIEQFRQSRSKYKTANLWFQYMDMICILRDFIKAERTGNWTLHLESLKAMLPYFTASGHNLYAKSAWIYINQMECLKEHNAEVAALFEAGYHVIRRTDQYWAGISSDLAIEQALMRSIKTTGGLTRGRGMSESQRALWILSMPDCAEVNNAMMSFTGTKFYSSDQHKEDGVSRKKRDTKDTMIFASFLEERNPFIEEEGMRNIETGVSATSDVNADRAKDIGLGILKSMEGKCVSDFTFKRKHQAITLQDKPICVNVEPEIATIDPQLLFQRFIVAADSIYEDKSEIFSYELSSQPSSMFDSSGFMRAASKSTLADAIWNLGDCNTEYTDTVYSYVVDGGSLMHKIPWKSGLTFGEICKRYVDSVKCNGPNSVVVVFDGYVSGPDTKDAMHLKRTKGIFGTKVTITETT